ncbi:hypothetical protein WN944_029563 [Citrus x changshan-huyou]|uniref:RNase H type-1 domain-containing protein n=1 Tax=Citrus x changshan-huyou TaxID=2935761 RepID=A0AAP0LM96_9ROSI
MKLSFDDITLELNMFNIVKDLIEEYIQDEVSTNSMEICLVVHLNRVRNWNVILLTEEKKEEEAHKLELKPFPEEFEYVCLGDQQTFPTENAAPEAEAVSTVATSTGAASASSTTVSLPPQPLSRSSGPISHSLILGLKYALQKGFFNFRVRGDSKLVHMQPFLHRLLLDAGCWLMEDQTPGMAELCGEAKRLKDKFLSI